ncbi:MAG: transcription-repair coupling factor [bacterium]|nr:transcription-repair coupling factor [bacterium]
MADVSGLLAFPPVLNAALESRSVQRLIGLIEGGKSVRVSGCTRSAAAYLIALLRARAGRTVVVLTAGPREVEEAAEDLRTFGGGEVLPFPAWETLPEEKIEPHPDVLGDRFLTLARLAGMRDPAGGISPEGAPPAIIVTSLRAVAQRVALPRAFRRETLEVAPGRSLPMGEILRRLEEGGYRRVDMVEEKGDYCVRGGIVDCFPPAAEYPFRIEYCGEGIETIRTFHAQTQRSIGKVERMIVTPFSEFGLLARQGGDLGTLLDYLPADALLALSEPAEVRRLLDALDQGGDHLLSRGEMHALLSRLQTLSLSSLPGGAAAPPCETMEIAFESMEPYRALSLARELGADREKRIFGHVADWAGEGIRTVIVCNTEGERARLAELLKERGAALPAGSAVEVGRLSGGFLFREGRIALLTDAEIFARYKVRRPRRRFRGRAALREFTELRPGDHVVHVHHGIGLYRGVTRLEKDGAERDFLCIEYDEKAKLYVPIEQAGLVERYIGLGASPPALDRLGGARWRNASDAARRAIFDYAAEILRLQAVRRSAPGFAFPPDASWQKEFEDAFIWEETPDQEAAISEIKRDLERPQPMDRLVCGDVGYGKTEVAMRAAFKAVMAGRQVAVLVPTTVLAQQHFGTFTERFADYPVRIEMLSRFRTDREQREVVEGLRRGTVDIVIGTHRLVQADVGFRNLGLAIIDEEQRFGVRHKERLKTLRLVVDVLTMTATPIPRTLYMSLSGIRDMSAISTPPEDRLAIETVVAPYDERLIREAARRELARQGQVFFVHNRVETIGRVRERLERLLPDARIAVGHGRMPDDALEEVMRRFVEGAVDVLLCTTIIESGLDIPNANTIIIDRADRFGLADLYQLRGRVGRYRRRAYAYLLYPPEGVVADDARRRLKAIVEHSGLGSGFRIALRDLEIRGAGNILGPEQHGHIAAVGFDLYCKLLKRSIAALEGRDAGGIDEVEVNLPYAAGLPADYIRSEECRIDLFKRLGEIAAAAEVDEFAAELKDRFGPPPPEAEVLMEVCLLKIAARGRGIRSVAVREGRIIAVRGGEEIRPGGRYPRVTAADPLDAVREIRRRIEEIA